MNNVLHYIRSLAAREAHRDDPDGVLLRAFLDRRDETAFAVLVERHGPLLLAACRRWLQREQDAEDVLQATFLVFVRRASSIRRSASVGSWLYGVAHRLALKLRTRQARQQTAEQRAVENRRTVAELTLDETQAILDEELQRLPEKYRAPLLLCCLDGKSRDEAARELGWAVGAVKIRLERGRQLLRDRLTRRGVQVSAALFTTLLGQTTASALPVRLAAGTVENCLSGAASEGVAWLVAGEMLPALRWHVLTALFLTLGAVGLGTLFIASERTASVPMPPPIQSALPDKVEKPAERGGPTLTGLFRSVDGREMIVRIKEVDRRYLLAADAAIVVDGKAATVGELKPRCRIRGTLSAQDELIRVEAVGPVVNCAVTAVDAVARTLTVQWPSGDSGPAPRMLTIDEKIPILIDGASSDLSQLREGMQLVVQLSLDGKAIRGIQGRQSPTR